ncbi:MAG: hypothetical protein O7D32_02975 [bacterium]|nr:hypothetical protein [bacterium]
MKHALLFAVLALLVLATGCKKKHPVHIQIDPTMTDGTIERIAVFPFASSLHKADDPDGMAPRMMDQLFRVELNNRNDWVFMAPTSVLYALKTEGLESEGNQFVETWRKTRTVDPDFLSTLNNALHVDALMIGVVDLWQKDEIDVQETSAATTYVGATVTIIGMDGTILFDASDEAFLEGIRSEERTVIRSGSGQVFSDPGSSLYNAPDYEEVAIKVVKALVYSIPVR